jgi:translation initiation factor 2B subunit (eIF-2B alpha/beta/delta family)
VLTVEKDNMHANLVEEIKKDRVSGASEISRKACSVFVAFAKGVKATSGEEYFDKLLKLGIELVLAQPHMASVFNLANSILYQTEELLPTLSMDELREFTKEKAEGFYHNSLNSVQKIAENGKVLIENGSKVVTFSSSGSILSILKAAKEEGKEFEVIVCESRPMFEGRLLAKFLGNAEIPVTLITDAALGVFAPEAALFLVGADSISEDTFVNKVGTKYVCLLSKEHDIPLYLACERSKFISSRWRLKPMVWGDPEQVLDSELPNVEVKNPCFEEIPLFYCQEVITNEGFLSPRDIPHCIRKTRLCEKLMEGTRGSITTMA